MLALHGCCARPVQYVYIATFAMSTLYSLCMDAFISTPWNCETPPKESKGNLACTRAQARPIRLMACERKTRGMLAIKADHACHGWISDLAICRHANPAISTSKFQPFAFSFFHQGEKRWHIAHLLLLTSTTVAP